VAINKNTSNYRAPVKACLTGRYPADASISRISFPEFPLPFVARLPLEAPDAAKITSRVARFASASNYRLIMEHGLCRDAGLGGFDLKHLKRKQNRAALARLVNNEAHI